ncbi:MAG: hypothetical protein JNN00_10515 [Chitinophagaceae bacterium]|nr:hypothetical protein [Chitinophagaceae bacterium]
MKSLLKILLISSSLYACNNRGDSNTKAPEVDSASYRDSAKNDHPLQYDNDKTQNFPEPAGIEANEKEITRQITSVLLYSKSEINQFRTEISDSLSKAGLPPGRRSFFVKTIRQLESGAELINKELENVLITDLQKNHDKLSGIIKNMKASEKELGKMIARLDKINGYIQLASSLIQSLAPVSVPAKKQNSDSNKQ